MDIVVLGPKGGETKIVLNDGSGLQKDFLNKTFVKKVLGPTAREIIDQADIHIRKRQEEMEKNRCAMRSWGLMLYASMLLFLCQYLGV